MRTLLSLFGVSVVLALLTTGISVAVTSVSGAPAQQQVHLLEDEAITAKPLVIPVEGVQTITRSVPIQKEQKKKEQKVKTTPRIASISNTPTPVKEDPSHLFRFSAEEAIVFAEELKTRIPHVKIKGEADTTTVTHKLALVNQALKLFPEQYTKSLRYLTINMTAEGARGLGGANTVIIKGYGLSDEEFVSVFVHELGHVIDLGYLRNTEKDAVKTLFKDGANPILSGDKSASFYGISWHDTDHHHRDTKKNDFVTGYAKSDPFEDFAESFIYYVFHGEQFRQMAAHNDAIAEKYHFLKETVFVGKEYHTGTITVSSAERSWDATKLHVQLEDLDQSHILALQ